MNHQAEFEIQDVFYIEGRGVVVAGKLLSGELKPGMGTEINGKTSGVKSIEVFNRKADALRAGESAGILLSDVKKEDVSRGTILSF
ncbi:MAG: hypothetical protein A2939_05485 [Parcubacteria group bacterium RIFCSPLOWO2_01_FULL_48_18]|nr:MAG: hypothetical protein A3J67_06485 [Parcubacteria group bacterium RIFCSPHIGHO2_02_FULL_48_10b]OHB22550.1 MAG: hypothetical protein A2939_05485 [Parcubacteria group bacterium RIFCSPLOWO2_01_FULL_48_18]